MTTFIYDNGQDYSDHQIMFVSLDLPPDTDLKRVGNAVNFLISCRYGYYSKLGKVLGAGQFEWWHGSTLSMKDLREYADEAEHVMETLDSDDADFEQLNAVYADALWLLTTEHGRTTYA